MQEHEHEQSHNPLSEAELTEDLSGYSLVEQVAVQSNGEIASEMDELMVEMRDRRIALRLGRWLVVGLALSFLACVTTIWLSGTLLSVPTQVLPIAFLKLVAANRIFALCMPLACLIVCYLALRSLTSAIMAAPERYLDERQKILRDHAHRSAFKIIKFSSVLIPVAFILPHLPWFNSPASVATHPSTSVVAPFLNTLPRSIVVFDAQGKPDVVTTTILGPGSRITHWHQLGQIWFSGTSNVAPVQPTPFIQQVGSPEIVLAGGLLLVTLLLIVSALPMAVLAWKGEA